MLLPPDCSILLTGGLGFLGSVCLEQLLRLTEVKSVYLLVRGKRHVPAEARVQELLCGPLFHLLHMQAAAGSNPFNRVRVVVGDLCAPGLGLTEADREALLARVDVVIHCAANLTLDAHIQDTLSHNYMATKRLLELASQMRRLRVFASTSTYFVNNAHPPNTPVKERVHYPALQLAGDSTLLDHASLVDNLLALPCAEAHRQAAALMARLNFVSTYAFGKMLTEQLLDAPGCLPGVAKIIVRPSLISALAGPPTLGTSLASLAPPGYCLAYGMGFFSSIKGVAFASDGIIDVIPCDTTAALLVVAAAAAAAHGPYEGSGARVYHAASAASNPELSTSFFDRLAAFWSANPPPFRLPFAKYPSFSGPHLPTPQGLHAARRSTAAKVWVAAKLLQLRGHGRQVCALRKGVVAFGVQNTLGYARSIVSRVDNGRELQRSLSPQEQQVWRIIWEAGHDDWDTYAFTGLAGLRTLLLKLPLEGVATPLPHLFEVKAGLTDRGLMQAWMARGDGANVTSPPISTPISTASIDDTRSTTSASDMAAAADCSVAGSTRSCHVVCEVVCEAEQPKGAQVRHAAGLPGCCVGNTNSG